MRRRRSGWAGVPLAVVALLLARCGGGSGSENSGGPPDAGARPDAGGGSGGIGPAGGTVRSSDGTLTLDIPAGALASDTAIEIQPIANTAPGGLGSAFRLLPAGTTFSVPVRLTFALTPADLEGTTLDGIGVGFEGTDGRWRSVNDVTRTPSSASVSTTHFSDWSRLVGWQIRPPQKRVGSGDHVALQVVDCEPTEPDDDGLTRLLAACPSEDVLTPLVSGWAVDGIPGGNLAVGVLHPQPVADKADYQAPIVVAEETHAVSVEFMPLLSHPKVLLVSDITVTGAAGFTIVGDLDVEGTNEFACLLGSSDWIKDGVRFRASQGSDGTWSASDIVNQPTDYDRELSPLPGVSSVHMDADPDLFFISSVTVEPAGTRTSLVNVTISGTQTTGACTATMPDGSTVPLAAQTNPNQYVFTFDSALLTQTVGMHGLGWYFEITKE